MRKSRITTKFHNIFTIYIYIERERERERESCNQGRKEGGGGECPQNSQVIYSTRSYLHTQGQSVFLHAYRTCTVY